LTWPQGRSRGAVSRPTLLGMPRHPTGALALVAALALASCRGGQEPVRSPAAVAGEAGEAEVFPAGSDVLASKQGASDAGATGEGEGEGKALTLSGVLSALGVGQREQIDGLFDGRLEAQLPHARAVAADVLGAAPPSASASHFEGEWALARRQMAVIGLSQFVLAHPEQKGAFLPAIERAAGELVSEASLAFAARKWRGESGLASLGGPHGHAYLGYVALALCFEAAVEPASPRAALARRMSDSFARRLDASAHGLIETYPGEAYPPDVALVLGAVGLCDRVVGGEHPAAARAARSLMASFTDPASGYLVQKASVVTGKWQDAPRGSGTALAAFALAYVDARASRALDAALARAGHVGLWGLGGVREYPPGTTGAGDVDSGPIFFGLSVSATGFAVASARLHRDRRRFRELMGSVELFGAPVSEGDQRRYTSAGALGEEILFAMMTAGPLAAPTPR
jgi:hypothetical protein